MFLSNKSASKAPKENIESCEKTLKRLLFWEKVSSQPRAKKCKPADWRSMQLLKEKGKRGHVAQRKYTENHLRCLLQTQLVGK